MSRLISVHEAQQYILSEFSPVSTTRVELKDACGRVLSQDIETDSDLPPFANSSMDGFAVRAADLVAASPQNSVILQVVADIPAGVSPTAVIQAGQAARIMTGAPIPDGADAVVPIEDTNYSTEKPEMRLPEQVKIFRPTQPGAFIRPQGQDVRRHQLVWHAGTRIYPQDVGLLAMLGVTNVPVYRKPRLALFSSGDELIDPAVPLTPGKIRNANSYMLAALIEHNGGEAVHLATASDRAEAVRRRLQEAIKQEVALIVTSAGVSVGAYDFVRAIIEEEGRLNFWRVNMRPGKPVAFGSYRNTPVIGLPGNPVSAFVGFQLFVLPVLNRLCGLKQPQRKMVTARLTQPIESDGRESYLRAVLKNENNQFTVTLTGHQGSGNLYSLVQANALLIVPAGVKSLPGGFEVDVWILKDEIEQTIT